MNKLDHPNIVKIKHLIQLNGVLYTAMELLQGGTLHDLLRKRVLKKKRLTDLEASTLIKAILSAVAYMHKNAIVHRDLKPQNILVDNEDDLGSVKLIDFGLAA